MKLDTRVLPDIDALSRAALEELLSDLQDAIKQRGRGAIALSGGHTPEKMYTLWAANEKYRNETDWNRVHFFWGDERYVPHDDPLSNYRMTRETLLENVADSRRQRTRGSYELGDAATSGGGLRPRVAQVFRLGRARIRRHAARSGSRGPHRFAFSRFSRARRKKPAGSYPFT